MNVSGQLHIVESPLVQIVAASAGGGINSTGDAVGIENSLLAGNDAPIGPDCAPEVVSGGHNLVGSLRNCNLSASTTGNITDRAPGIDELSSLTAQTFAHPLLRGSPAIGRANCVLATDQNGAQRSPDDGCDIGAVEADNIDLSLFMPIIGR